MTPADSFLPRQQRPRQVALVRLFGSLCAYRYVLYSDSTRQCDILCDRRCRLCQYRYGRIRDRRFQRGRRTTYRTRCRTGKEDAVALFGSGQWALLSLPFDSVAHESCWFS